MKTYTISASELDAVAALTLDSAPIDLVTPDGPIQPTQVRNLRGGWVGAEWVRVVADYQDGPSVGYASMGDLAHDHEWTADVVPEFTPVGPYRIESRLVGGRVQFGQTVVTIPAGPWEAEGSGDVYDSFEAAEAAMAEFWTVDDEGSPLEYRVVTVRS